jgi:hypothetical protein
MPHPSSTAHAIRRRFKCPWKSLAGVATGIALALPAPVAAQETVTRDAPAYSLQAAIADAALLQTDRAASTAAREDGKFQFVMGAFLTVAGTDIATTMYHLGQGTAREVGFGGWWQHRPVTFAVTKSAATALFAYQLQKLHKTRPKTAMVLGIVGAGFEASLVARTARIGSRARQAR